MKLLLQRVSRASVSVGGETVGAVGPGYMALVGCRSGDTPEDADRLAVRAAALRVFEDAEGRMNRSVLDVGGSVLAISQFTLYADCRRGNRPSFTGAGDPSAANELYEYYVKLLRETHHIADVQTGEFGAHMKVELLNDGPVTILLDSEELERPRRA